MKFGPVDLFRRLLQSYITFTIPSWEIRHRIFCLLTSREEEIVLKSCDRSFLQRKDYIAEFIEIGRKKNNIMMMESETT